MMFFHTHVDQTTEDLLAMMETIWIRHIQNLRATATADDIALAKKIFFARHGDNDLVDRRTWRKYGVSANNEKREGGIRKLRTMLAEKFGADLGLKPSGDPTWNSQKFRRENPNLKLDRCRYTGQFPTDLHHLLSRRDYPEFIYHPENVVPLNVQAHAYITRGLWSPEIQTMYNEAIKQWLKAPEGSKLENFDEAMNTILNQMNPA